MALFYLIGGRVSAPGELEYVPIGTNQHITSKKKKKKNCTRMHTQSLWSHRLAAPKALQPYLSLIQLTLPL